MPATVPSIFIYADALSPNPPHTGLSYSYYGGNILTSTGFVNVPEGSLLLPNNASCYIECSNSGVVSYSLVGFTPGSIRMAKVTTFAFNMLRWEDRREPSKISNTFIPSGGGGGGGPVARYTHTQSSPAATWTVTHNLGAYVQVVVVNNANEILYADVTYLSPNSLKVDFGSATVGSVYVI